MTTYIFIASFIGIVSLLLIRALELRFNRFNFVSSTFEKGDAVVYAVLEKIIFKYNRYKKITHIFIFEFLPSYIYELLVKAKDYVAKKYYSVGDDFRGRRVLRNKGSVSFFLERLSEDRK